MASKLMCQTKAAPALFLEGVVCGGRFALRALRGLSHILQLPCLPFVRPPLVLAKALLTQSISKSGGLLSFMCATCAAVGGLFCSACSAALRMIFLPKRGLLRLRARSSHSRRSAPNGVARGGAGTSLSE